MRALLMAFLAMNASGLGSVAGRARIRPTKTSAKKTTATTV